MKKQIIILGGGIVGSTAAFYLSQSTDYDLTLIDHAIGSASRAAAGIICPWLSQRRNMDWYRLTVEGAAFYEKLLADLEPTEKSPYQQTGTLVFKKKASLLEKLYRLAEERRLDAPRIGHLSIWQGQDLQELISPLQIPDGAVLTSGGGRVDGASLLDLLQERFQENGGRLITGKAQLLTERKLIINEEVLHFDQIILASGAWLGQVLAPLGYQVDVRPQKGQLLEIESSFASDQWPGCMLSGEIDILPFEAGRIVIGASHEDHMGFDLTVDDAKIATMKKDASQLIPQLGQLPISKTRVGTRAYTSTYLPFYGNLADNSHIWVASGLGSSGLTSGPFIGWQIAQEITEQASPFDRTPYAPDNYITKSKNKSEQ